MNAYFNNKVIWITGASSGIEKALVKELAVKVMQRLFFHQEGKISFIQLLRMPDWIKRGML